MPALPAIVRGDDSSELVHPEPAKTLPLYARKGGSRPVRKLERYARLFNLPPLVED